MDIRKSLAITLSLVAAMATAQTTTWREHAAASFAGGTGTAEDPYLITTAEELARVAALTYGDSAVYEGPMGNYDVYAALEGKYFRLENDIDLDGYTWDGIGGWATRTTAGKTVYDEYKFMGVFDGNGKSVSNMEGYYGLFGSTGLFAEVRDVTVASGYVTSQGTSTFTGGIVGNNRGIVEDCVNHASVSSLFFYPGGIVGVNSRGEDGSLSGTVRRCVNYGTVSSQPGSSNGMGSGGIAGANDSHIDQCANYGPVSAVTGAGGIAAFLEVGSVTNCYNRGTVTATSEQAAGLVTNVLGRLGKCRYVGGYNAGIITAPVSAASLSVALFAMPDVGKPTDDHVYVSAIYNDADVCPGLRLYESSLMAFIVEDSVADMTTAEMQSPDFAELLNTAGATDQWVCDESNEGYPTFKWFVERGMSGIEAAPAEGLPMARIYGLDGRVVVDGIDEADVTVHDMSGMTVARGSIESVGARTLDSGIYIVTVAAGGRTVSTKVAL